MCMLLVVYFCPYFQSTENNKKKSSYKCARAREGEEKYFFFATSANETERVGNRATEHIHTHRHTSWALRIQRTREEKNIEERSGEKKAREKRNNTQNGSTKAARRLFMKHSPMYMPFYKYRVVYTERRQAIAIFSLLLIYTHIFSFYIVLNDEFFCLPASTFVETFGRCLVLAARLTLYHSFRLRELSHYSRVILLFSRFSRFCSGWLALLFIHKTRLLLLASLMVHQNGIICCYVYFY